MHPALIATFLVAWAAAPTILDGLRDLWTDWRAEP
jgi:hypothetical protein